MVTCKREMVSVLWFGLLGGMKEFGSRNHCDRRIMARGLGANRNSQHFVLKRLLHKFFWCRLSLRWLACTVQHLLGFCSGVSSDHIYYHHRDNTEKQWTKNEVLQERKYYALYTDLKHERSLMKKLNTKTSVYRNMCVINYVGYAPIITIRGKIPQMGMLFL